MARDRNIYKPLRRKHGEGTGKFATIGLKEDIAQEFKFLVKAYSDIYGQKMTPTQVIKRLMDAGVKRCDPDVFGTFLLLKQLESESSFYNDNLMELHSDNPDLFFNHEVDPTEGDVWNMLYLAEKSGEVEELQMDKDHQFCGEINGVQTSFAQLLDNGWTIMNEAGVILDETQAKIIADRIFKHKHSAQK